MYADRAQMNTFAAAYCDGSFAAAMASFLMILAGIALAVSVVFFSIILAVRLCVLVCVCIVPLLAVIPCTEYSRER